MLHRSDPWSTRCVLRPGTDCGGPGGDQPDRAVTSQPLLDVLILFQRGTGIAAVEVLRRIVHFAEQRAIFEPDQGNDQQDNAGHNLDDLLVVMFSRHRPARGSRWPDHSRINPG